MSDKIISKKEREREKRRERMKKNRKKQEILTAIKNMDM